MKPPICVSIKCETTEQIVESILKAESADLIEVRLDYRRGPINLSHIRKCTGKPLIATNRRRDQGWGSEDSEIKRVQLLLDAVDEGFDYVDIALTTENLEEINNQLIKRGARTILSYHDFIRPLNIKELERKHIELSCLGGSMIKIIGWTNNCGDNLPYLEYNRKHPGNISFGMGEHGVISRILAPLSGAAYTYASLDTGLELAPGQVSLNSLREIYRSLSL